MQTFKDTVTGEVWQFEDDVKVTNSNGTYSFETASGDALSNVPATLQPYTIPTPTAAEILTTEKSNKLIEIKNAFINATKTSQCNLSLGWAIDCRRSGEVNDIENMQTLLDLALLEGKADTDKIDAPGIKGADNTFHDATIAELRDTIIPEMKKYGLAQYQKKFTLESQIDAATTVADVQAVVWS